MPGATSAESTTVGVHRAAAARRTPSPDCICQRDAKADAPPDGPKAAPAVDTFESRLAATEEKFPPVLLPPPRDRRLTLWQRALEIAEKAAGVCGRVLRHMTPRIQFGIGINLWQLWPK